MNATFEKNYNKNNLPLPTIRVESVISPKNLDISVIDAIEKFRPFGIGNPKPLWLLENVTITEIRSLGADKKHAKIFIAENPSLNIIMWSGMSEKSLQVGNIVSLVVFFEKNIWKEKTSLQVFVQEIAELKDENEQL